MAPNTSVTFGATAGVDPSMLYSGQSVDHWKQYFGNPTAKDPGLFNAIQSIGPLSFLWLHVSGGLGRKAGIVFGATIVLVGAILQICTQNLGMFVGFGTSFAQMASPLLISEVAYPTHRAPLTSLYNSLWFSGSIVAAWSTFGAFRIDSDWSRRIFRPSHRFLFMDPFHLSESLRPSSDRIPSALQALSSVIQILFVWFLPESPRRWHQLARSFSDIWKSSAHEDQWSGNGLISYYLTKVLDGIGITNSNDQTLLSGILAIYNFIIAITASMSVERIGRRPFFVTSTTGMLVSYAIITAMSGTYKNSPSVGAGRTLLAFAFIFNGFYAITYTPLLVSYTVEILPFLIRAEVPNPIALEALKWKSYLIYTYWLVLELVYIWLWATETKGRSLQETGALFDGQDAVDELTNRTGHDMTEGGHRAKVSPVDSHDEKLNLETSHREHVH